MKVRYREKVEGHYVVITLHRVFVDDVELTEEFEGWYSDSYLFETVKSRVRNGEHP